MVQHSEIVVRRALVSEADAIAQLNNFFADQQLMLHRTSATIAVSIEDYVVAVDAFGQLLGCGALKEYSPSIAEVAAVAVSTTAQGTGIGRQVVAAVEALARKRGIPEVFALTLAPTFFEAMGYVRVDRARYPEKIRRDCIGCARRFACNETCFAKPLIDLAVESWEVAA